MTALTTALGRINSTGNQPLKLDTAYDTKYGTYLKLFSGELFKGFQHNTIARDLVMKRTLKNGKSLQFIYTGRMSASYHEPGSSILGQENALPVAEKTIQMDDLLVSSAFVYNLDETLAHYELRGEISKKIGYALAERYDRNIFRSITRGARQVSPISATGKIEPGGGQVSVGSDAGDSLKANKLIDAFYNAAAMLDEKGVSSQGRVAVLTPRQYYALIQNTGNTAAGLINRDVEGTALQSGKGVVEIAGIKVFKSMNIPFKGKFGTTNAVEAGEYNGGSFVGQAIDNQKNTVDGVNNNYGDGTAAGDNAFSQSCGLIFQKEAAGVVEAIGPQVQVTSGDISVIYQGDVILGRLAMGADYLNPACAVELYEGASGNDAF
tara:strand:+ start:45 stop:1181 length:1137 start_codon:yes stop_codon:yes gene_type:complete